MAPNSARQILAVVFPGLAETTLRITGLVGLLVFVKVTLTSGQDLGNKSSGNDPGPLSSSSRKK